MLDKIEDAHWSDAGAEAALERGRIAQETEPRVVNPRNNAKTHHNCERQNQRRTNHLSS